MREFFDSKQPVKAVRAFYNLLLGWDETACVEISRKYPTRATFHGEMIDCLIPGKRYQFKEFVERYAVGLGPDENYDDFFACYDRALDAVDPGFRRTHGIFFTDIFLSRFAMWFVKQKIGNVGKSHLVIDPAGGSGNLVTSWRTPLELRHKVVSEIEPELLFAIERRMKGDQWHQLNGFTVVPKVDENLGLNFIDKSAGEYLAILRRYLEEHGQEPTRPLAFLCNPPYRNDDDQTTGAAGYDVHPSIIQLTGEDQKSERYCCFLAQMKLICQAATESGIPGESLLLLFTKSSWLTNRTNFRSIRTAMLSCFEDVGGILVNSKEFFDVSGSFPVAFSIWRYKGPSADLDVDRGVDLIDLTWLRRETLAKISWDDPKSVDRECDKILANKSSIVVPFGQSRQSIKEWSGSQMMDFKRARRKDEENTAIVGGLPAKDRRLENKKAYGESDGVVVGFMDDLTPCRVKRGQNSIPWFRLDSPIMDHRKARCLSGPPDQKGYAPLEGVAPDKLFIWFAIERVFDSHGYPMWADALELWAPVIPSELTELVVRMSYAIALAENECVVTRFSANNPVRGAREVFVTNPMCPRDPSSYWSLNVAQRFRGVADPATDLVREICELYDVWAKRFRRNSEIYVSYERPYFIDEGFLTPTSGLLQIRDFANETGDVLLMDRIKKIQVNAKELKRQFHHRVVARDSDSIAYFGKPRDTAPAPLRAKTKFQQTLEKRLAIASLLVSRLHEERHFGRTKLAKLFYLCDAETRLRLETEYRREAAGPLDARALYNESVGIEALAHRHGYFSASKTTSRSEAIRYQPGPNLREITQRAPRVLGDDACEKIERLIQLFAEMDTDQCEIVATLYAVWNDLLLRHIDPLDASIIDEFLGHWHERKVRFSRVRLTKALRWMKTNELTPSGEGKRTEKPDRT